MQHTGLLSRPTVGSHARWINIWSWVWRSGCARSVLLRPLSEHHAERVGSLVTRVTQMAWTFKPQKPQSAALVNQTKRSKTQVNKMVTTCYNYKLRILSFIIHKYENYKNQAQSTKVQKIQQPQTSSTTNRQISITIYRHVAKRHRRLSGAKDTASEDTEGGEA